MKALVKNDLFFLNVPAHILSTPVILSLLTNEDFSVYFLGTIGQLDYDDK